MLRIKNVCIKNVTVPTQVLRKSKVIGEESYEYPRRPGFDPGRDMSGSVFIGQKLTIATDPQKMLQSQTQKLNFKGTEIIF